MKVVKLVFGIVIYYPVSIHIPLPTLNSDIKNKKLLIAFKGFKRRVNLSFERKYRKGSLEISEYYFNGNLWMYNETEKKKDKTIIKSFGSKGDLFAINKVFTNQKCGVTKEYNWVLNADGTITEGISTLN